MPKETFNNLKNEKKERIKKGLIDVFGSLGYDQTTVSTIIKACDIPRGSFYQYFEDKFDAFYYIILEIQSEKMKYLEPLTSKIGQIPFLDLYVDLFDQGIEFAFKHPDAFKIGQILYKSHSYEMERLWASFEDLAMNYYCELLKIDQKAGNIRKDVNIEMVARILYRLNSVDIVEEFIKGKDKEALLKIAVDSVKILKDGIKELNNEKESI
ncbi:MAG: TetR/AcrR family transcriptional regulator [Candidatus Izemoplasmataceae bacterium]